jgi:hypothetical protein
MGDQIKITMLGASQSGKTCYMVGMYAMMKLGVNGLTITAQSLNDDLDLGDKWDRMIEVKGKDRWPEATSRAAVEKTYRFNFNHGFQTLMSFEWLDYRGGAMNEEENEPEIQKLVSYLADSSCVFLCVSGEHLAQPLTDEHGSASRLKLLHMRRKTMIERMELLLKGVYDLKQPTAEKPFPVVVVITKADLCTQHRTRHELVNDIKQLFPRLFERGGGWLTLISSVTLGSTLVDDPNNNEIDPINLHIPVAFAIFAHLRARVAEAEALRSSASERLTRARNANPVVRLFRRGEIRSLDAEANRTAEQRDDIERRLLRLTNELVDRVVFLDGREMEIEGDQR